MEIENIDFTYRLLNDHQWGIEKEIKPRTLMASQAFAVQVNIRDQDISARTQ